MDLKLRKADYTTKTESEWADDLCGKPGRSWRRRRWAGLAIPRSGRTTSLWWPAGNRRGVRCLLPFPILCHVFQQKWEDWSACYPVHQQYTREFGGYHSEVVFVPRMIVWDEIYKSYSGNPQAESHMTTPMTRYPLDAEGALPFVIDEEFRSLIPPLTAEERAGLEESLLRDGCLDTLIVWREPQILLDGHHRKETCDQYGIDYAVREISLPDWEAAADWIDAHQLGRRNLTPEQMSLLAWPEVQPAEEFAWRRQKILVRIKVSK